MGLRDDLRRFREVGEKERQDLEEFIEHGDLGNSSPETINIPIKIIELPEFVYDKHDMGGVAQGDLEEGDPVGDPEEGDPAEPGDEEGEHGHYDMDPEEFAEELDEELGLDLEPKGKQVIEEVEGDLTETAKTGPRALMRFDEMFAEALKRKLSLSFDEDFMRAVLQIDGWGPKTAFDWAREESDPRVPVSLGWLENEYERLRRDDVDLTKYASIEEVQTSIDRTPISQRIREEGIDSLPFQRDDEEFHYPDIEKKREKNVVVVNIRDVSGSMHEKKRELVERVYTPLDWYLRGKYDNIETVYIAHDATAWEVAREDFFGIRSGGGTRISTAYQLAREILDERYPWSEWNRYVFCAGDGENYRNDSNTVVELMGDIDANLHAYLEVQPDNLGSRWAEHADVVEEAIGTKELHGQDVAVARVSNNDEVMDAIKQILSTEDQE